MFSEASQEGEKRREKLDIHLYMCRVGGVRTPKPHNNPISYSSLPKDFPSAAAAVASATASRPTLGSWARHSILTPWARSGGWLVPLLLVVPLPGTGPSPSLFLHLLPYQPAVASPTGKGREGGCWLRKRRDRSRRRGMNGPSGLSYLKWLCMILIIIYIEILRPF